MLQCLIAVAGWLWLVPRRTATFETSVSLIRKRRIANTPRSGPPWAERVPTRPLPPSDGSRKLLYQRPIGRAVKQKKLINGSLGVLIMCKWEMVNNAARAYAVWVKK